MFCSAKPKSTFPNLQKERILNRDKIAKGARLGYVSSLFCQSRDGERIRAYKLNGEPEALDQLIDSGALPENHTNEAKLDEDAMITQNKDPVGVAANSGVDSGLDKQQQQPGTAEGKEEFDQGYSRVVAKGRRDSSAASSAVAVRGRAEISCLRFYCLPPTAAVRALSWFLLPATYCPLPCPSTVPRPADASGSVHRCTHA